MSGGGRGVSGGGPGEGCEWRGAWGDLGGHVERECQYTEVMCPKGCGVSCKRKALSSHLTEECPNRDVRCKFCDFVCSLRDMEERHMSECSKYPLACPNGCGEMSIERGRMGEHQLECPLQVIDCEFSHAGCMAKPVRRALESHLQENIQYHLRLLCRLCHELNQRLREREEQVDSLVTINLRLHERQEEMQSILEDLKLTSLLPPVLFTLHHYSMYRDSHRAQRWDRSPAIHTHSEGCRVRLCLLFRQSSAPTMDIELWQVPSDTDSAVQWPVRATVSVDILRPPLERSAVSAGKEGGKRGREDGKAGGRGAEKPGEEKEVAVSEAFTRSKEFILEHQEKECCVGDICYLYYSGLNNYVVNDSLRFRLDIHVQTQV